MSQGRDDRRWNANLRALLVGLLAFGPTAGVGLLLLRHDLKGGELAVVWGLAAALGAVSLTLCVYVAVKVSQTGWTDFWMRALEDGANDDDQG